MTIELTKEHIEEAYDLINRFDVVAMKKEFGFPQDMATVDDEIIYGLIWAIQHRTDPSVKKATILSMTMGQAKQALLELIEDPLVKQRTETSLNGVSTPTNLHPFIENSAFVSNDSL